MGTVKVFQICYEGDLNVELAVALRSLHAEPNFEKSWQVQLPDTEHSLSVLGTLRSEVQPQSRVLVAQSQLSRSREFLLVRHTQTSGCDYAPLVKHLNRLGERIELPFDGIHIVRTSSTAPTSELGTALGRLCPDDSLMVMGISFDFAFWSEGEGRMLLPLHDGEKLIATLQPI